jgi:hypothetical protein
MIKFSKRDKRRMAEWVALYFYKMADYVDGAMDSDERKNWKEDFWYNLEDKDMKKRVKETIAKVIKTVLAW